VGIDAGDAGGIIRSDHPDGAQTLCGHSVGGHCLFASRSSRREALNRGYVQTLEQSLRNHALELDMSDLEDLTTKTVMLRTLRERKPDDAQGLERTGSTLLSPVAASVIDRDVADVLALRSRDRERIMHVLRREEGLPAALSRVIPSGVGPRRRHPCAPQGG
jgi:hypothetical protein